jgi:hypothetical protein
MSNFIRGMTTAFCLMSLYQDILGLDGYVSYVRRSWVDGSITVPVAIAALMIISVPIRAKKP